MEEVDLDALLSDASVARLRQVLADRPDAVVSLTSADLTVLWATEPGATGVYKRSRSEYEGESTLEFVHPDDRQRWTAAIQHALKGNAMHFTGRALDAEGAWITVLSYLWPTRDGNAVVSVTVRSGN